MNKEHLALRNNFWVTKKFLIAKFDCTWYFCLRNEVLVSEKLNVNPLEKFAGFANKYWVTIEFGYCVSELFS